MKATIDIPDELYRQVKAKSAMQGQPVREVVGHLFQGWLGDTAPQSDASASVVHGREVPKWFGAARKYAQRVDRHDIDSIRRSIAHGRVHDDRSGTAETIRGT
jgi:hypothetical protein